MTIAIKIENLSKQYELRHQKQQRYVSLRDVITDKAVNALNNIRHFGSSAHKVENDLTKENFWALKDINLEINQGDRVGIIGRNGAGKSTLLKMLSRIIEPTSGKISIKGRISSLLEVGTGFHPELTGRENIFLNGSILGMRHHEITKKFDEIVAFADVEKFLDTPVKHYSSGMYMRLAFSVAAHLDPEILVVDEVLAVGDAQFQKKCLGKMKEVGSDGRTILFVSHNMNAVEQLCTKAVSLNRGVVNGNTSDVKALIKSYLFDEDSNMSCQWMNDGDEYKNPWFRPLSLSVTDDNSRLINRSASNNQDLWVEIKSEIEQIDPALTMGYAIYTEDGNLIYWTYQTDVSEKDWPIVKKGINVWRSKIPKNFLNEGSYKIELIGGLHFREWICEPGISAPSITFQINGGLSDSPFWHAKRPGILAPVLNWEIN